MGFIDYLTTAAPQFGPLAWLFFLGQIAGAAAGAYFYFLHAERNAIRQAFMRQLGIALMVLGGIGVLLGILRLLNVPTLNQRLWFWAQFVIELGVAGYVTYYMRTVLSRLEREARSRGGRPGTPRPPRPVPGEPAPVAPRPVATTSRRDARRDRKRKTR